MSDELLRTLETRWRASQAEEDLVAWLRAQHRHGVLSRDQLGLAALLGSSAAEALVAWDSWITSKTEFEGHRFPATELVQALHGVPDKALGLRVAVAAARRDHWSCPQVRAAEDWLLRPTKRSRKAARAAATELRQTCQEACFKVASCASARAPSAPALASLTLSIQLHGFLDAKTLAGGAKQQREFLADLRDELLPWLLGSGDPLARRVQARAESGEA